MYVWQGRYRKERLNVVAETLHQREVDEALDEALRHRLELEFVETSLQNIDTAIRKYLETADGSAEVDLVMPMMKLGRSLTSIDFTSVQTVISYRRGYVRLSAPLTSF